jgi:hypothetical protein
MRQLVTQFLDIGTGILTSLNIHETAAACAEGSYVVGAAGHSAVTGGLGPWRDAIAKVEALQPRHIIAGHQNRRLDDDATRTIAETRQYLDDAEELLRTENTAVDFFNAKIERYPDHLGRMILWVSARALYGVRERPGEDGRRIILASWL